MDRTPTSEIAALARGQHGVFTAVDARTVGFTRHQRLKRVERGTWEQLYEGVYRLAGTPPTWESRLLAACLAAGEHGAASHRSAAALWGLPGGSRDFVELTCRRWRRSRHDRLVVHESLAFDAAGVTVRSSIPVTSVDVTLLSLGAVVPESVVEQALDAAVNRSLTTMSSARRTLERLAKRGRDGCASLRAILDRRAPVIGTAQSPAETLLLRMLLGHGLPAPVLQYEVRDGTEVIARVDAAYPERRIAVEYDSYEHHTGRNALVRDAARRNRLLRLGWTVVTVTAEDLRAGGATVVATLRDLLRRAS